MPNLTSIDIAWAQTSPEKASASAFLARLMPQDSAYISHSEIQWGLSHEGEAWAEGAVAQLEGYFAQFLDDGGQIAQAIDAAGVLCAAAAVQWQVHTPIRFAIVQDIIVAPQARGLGLGDRLMHFIEAEARLRHMGWVFLESGVRNQRAQSFFIRSGYVPISSTFAKRLDDAAISAPSSAESARADPHRS